MGDLSPEPLPPFHSLIRSAFAELGRHTFQSLTDSLPETVYHYTNSSGLLGIAKSGELWATHISHLNDTSEFLFAETRLRHCLESVKPSSGFEERFLEKLAWRAATTFSMTKLVDVYVACFCERDDLLSMWRSYAGIAGYSIGFSSAELTAGSAEGFDGDSPWFARVLYTPASQDALLSRFIAGTFDVVQSVPGYLQREGVPIQEDEAIEVLLGNFASTVVPVLCFIKHPGFEEERELRVVQAGWTFANYPHGVTVRASDEGLIPYVRLRATGHEPFVLRSVQVGPCRSPGVAAAAAERLLVTHNHAACGVTVSGIPFRPSARP